MSKAYITKRRDLEFLNLPPGTTYTATPGGIISDSYGDLGDWKVTGRQTTTSRGNPAYQALNRLGKYSSYRYRKAMHPRARKALRSQDLGGDFQTTKHFFRDNHVYVELPVGSTTTVRGYTGYLFADSPIIGPLDSKWPTLSPVSNATLIQRGSTAIARTIPTNPLASLATSLGELREQLPQIPGRTLLRKGLSAHSGADEYLNWQFGIAPTISDVEDTVSSVNNFNKIVEQYQRDSGRNIRRRYSFPVERSTTVTNYADRYAYPSLTIYHGATKGKYQRTRTTTVKYTFSGCYTYYFDPGLTTWGKLKRAEQVANKLFGTRVTPLVAWNLMPWSWFVDWNSNAGDVISNVSALMTDGLVIRYAYIMAETTIEDTYTLSDAKIRSGSLGILSQTFGTTIKQRLKATPYGFGLNIDDFTSRQWSILGALGISKAPGKL